MSVLVRHENKPLLSPGSYGQTGTNKGFKNIACIEEKQEKTPPLFKLSMMELTFIRMGFFLKHALEPVFTSIVEVCNVFDHCYPLVVSRPNGKRGF